MIAPRKPNNHASAAEDKAMSLVSQIARFGLVGVINTAVDLAVLNALIALSHRGHAGALYSLFKTVSFLVAMLNSYWMNSRWAFRQTTTVNPAKRLGRFSVVSILGLAINVGSASWVATSAEPVGAFARLWPSVAALAGAACGLAFNFVGYRYLVFVPRPVASKRFPSDTPGEHGKPSVLPINGREQAGTRALKKVGRMLSCNQARIALSTGTGQPREQFRSH
jgi:putative flippase GtrA